MKKRMIAIILTIVLVLSMVACGNKASTDPTTEDKPDTSNETKDPVNTDEKITIKIANYALLEKGYTEFWESAKTGYEKKYPNVTIEWVTAPYGEILSQVINMAGAGDKVDLVFSEMIWIPALVDAGLAEPMDNVLDEEFLKDFYPNILEAHSIDGTLYAAPLYVSPTILFYNKDLFTKAGLDPATPPTTYDEMLTMAEKLSLITSDDGNKVFAFGQPTASVPVVGASLTAMAANFGGYVFNEDGTLNVENEGFVQSMEMLNLLNDKGYNPQNTKPKDLRNLFALGQLAMYYDNAWGFNGVKSINPDAGSFTATAMPLKGGAGTGASTLQSHCFVAIKNSDAAMEATKNFIQYVISTEVLEDYMLNITPAFPAKMDMENVLNPVLAGAKDSTELAIPSRMFPTVSNFYLELASLSQAVTVGETDVNTAIADFIPAAQSIIE
ncbi:MAG: ABC transporter substrate-binding protein [Mobilitalea sp.]